MRRLILFLIPAALRWRAAGGGAHARARWAPCAATNVGELQHYELVRNRLALRPVGGDLGKYRSDVNFRNGLRLLSSSLAVHSREGHGRWFDEILLNTLGLGNDPYQSATLRVQKNALYRYDLLWRLDEYLQPRRCPSPPACTWPTRGGVCRTTN